jgi:hypothetical protein
MNELERFFQLIDEARARMRAGGGDLSNRLPYGGSAVTLTQYLESLKSGAIKEVRLKETSISVPTDTMYGCTSLFGLCGPDDIIGLSMADDPLSTWLGWFPDTVCERFIKGITYFDQSGTAAGSVNGTVYGSSCDDPPTSEKGVIEFPQGDFGTLHGCGEGVRVTQIGERKCDKQPTYTLPIEGIGPVRIDNDLVLERIAAAEMVKHELSRELITGDSNITGQFDGLAVLVNNDYVDIRGNRAAILDSLVVDWQNDDLSGQVNGHGSIITKIRDMWRRIRQRISWSSLGMPREGDVVLVMPSWLAWAVLDEYAWWSFAPGAQYNEVFRDNMALRDFRERISVGMFGSGYIDVDGFRIHIIAHDWMPVTQSAPKWCGDIYLLTRQLGTRRILFGQYMPVELGQESVNSDAGYPYFGVQSIKGGRALTWLKFDNACVRPCLEIRVRLRLDAPWACGVINNVCVRQQFTPMSADPQSKYWMGDQDIKPRAATRVTQYWYGDTGWFH